MGDRLGGPAVTAPGVGAADEIVALYDPTDVAGRVVGSAPRSRVRAQNLPHAATAVLVRRPDGAIFVHRRADTKDLWPGAHDCAAGGVLLAGETAAAAARRELAEELGIEGVPLRELLTVWYRDQDTWYLAHVYEATWDGDVRFSDGEVSAGWWEPEASLRARLADPGWPFVPDTRFVLEMLDDAQRPDRPWPAGATVVHRFGRSGRTRFAHLATVVEDGPEGLLLWVGGQWPAVVQRLADGREVRAAPLAERPTAARQRRSGTWWGHGSYRLVPPGPALWSLWWFFDGGGGFRGWYGNLESPAVWRTTALGTHLVDTSDRALDVWVPADGRPQWKDEDEFAAFTGLPGYWTAAQAEQTRAAGEHLMGLARAGTPPFDGRWTVPPPATRYPVPSFPQDWDLPHLGTA